MQVIQQDNSWLQALGRWAALEEEARRRLTTEKLEQIEKARWMGDRTRLAELLGYNPQFKNPFSMEAPEISKKDAELSKMQSLGQTNMLGSINDMTDKNNLGNTPGPQLRESIANPKSWEDMTPQQQAAARQQQGLDVLLSLKNAGQPINAETISKIANMNAPGQSTILNKNGVNTGLMTESAIAKDSLEGNIAEAKSKKSEYDVGMRNYNASPDRREKWLTGKTAGEMREQVINAYHQAIVGKGESEQRRLYALAVNAMNDIGKAFHRGGPNDTLGGLPRSTGGGSGSRKPETWNVVFDNGKEASLTIPSDYDGDKNEYIIKRYGPKYSAKSIDRMTPVSPDQAVNDEGRALNAKFKEKGLLDEFEKIDSTTLTDEEKEKKKDIAAKRAGFTRAQRKKWIFWREDVVLRNNGDGSSKESNDADEDVDSLLGTKKK